jgi:hypothetical protein
MIHCHNLPHEDHDMMAQFSVGYDTNDPDPNDPIEAVKPHPIGEVVPVPGEAASDTSDGPNPTETAQATASAQPAQTSGSTTATQTAAPVTTQPADRKDVVTITTARHRLNKDITFAGTSRYTGTVTSAGVVLYDVTPGRTATRIGTASTQCPRQLDLDHQARAVAPHHCSPSRIQPRRHHDSGSAHPLRNGHSTSGSMIPAARRPHHRLLRRQSAHRTIRQGAVETKAADDRLSSEPTPSALDSIGAILGVIIPGRRLAPAWTAGAEDRTGDRVLKVDFAIPGLRQYLRN